MKMWIRIALVLFLLSNLAIEGILQIVLPQMDNEIISLHGEKLKAIAATAAAYIDGDIYEHLNFTSPKVKLDSNYIKIHDALKRAKETIKIKQDIYTLSILDSSHALYGITTNFISYSGDTLHVSHEVSKNAYKNVYRNHDCSFTGYYEDKYGKWLSGIAPIYNSKNAIVGLVQADNDASEISEKIRTKHDFINYMRWFLFPIILLMSLIISKILGSPITKIQKQIENLSMGDYSEVPKIKSFGEIKKLTNSASLLRNTIIEQQTKISNTISELRNNNIALEKEKVKSEASDKLKTEFLALISHEVRTPINVLQNFLTLLKDEIDEEKMGELGEIFDGSQNAFARLIRTIDMIVIMAELQTGSYDCTLEEVSIKSVVLEVCEKYKYEAADKNLLFSCATDDENYIVKADSYLLNQIVIQLIDNAIKFTEMGSVNITLQNENNTILFKIKDTGIGIGEESKEEIFYIFKQEDNGYTRRFEGNGLGLALVKQGCELINAKLYFESEKEKGTEFVLELQSVNINL